MSKRYGRRLVLADVDLRLEDGEFVLIVGANGAGKTTLLRILSTYAAPTSGRVAWDAPAGRPPPAPERIRAQLAVVGHQPLLYDELTAAENLQFVLRMHGRDAVDARTDRWLRAFGLAGRARERVAGFSRGLRQRLALARAFAVEPRLLLLDEPAASLDARGAETLVEHLGAVRSRAAVVLATHDPDPYRPLAGRLLEVKDRGVHAWGPAA